MIKKYKTGDYVYYRNPKTMDTVPAVIISPGDDCITRHGKVKIKGDWPTGTKYRWVNCGNLEYQKNDYMGNGR